MFGRDRGGREDRRTRAQKERDLNAAVAQAEQLASQRGATPESVRRQLPQIKQRYRLTTLTLRQRHEDTYQIDGEVNPKKAINVPILVKAPPGGSMRSQIQRSIHGTTEHLASTDVHASNAEKGVTAVEFEQRAMRPTFEKYKAPTEEGKPSRPRGNIPNIRSAMIRQSKRIRSQIVPHGGVREGQDLNTLRVTFPDSAERRKEVRIDLENLRGHNLRFKR